MVIKDPPVLQGDKLSRIGSKNPTVDRVRNLYNKRTRVSVLQETDPDILQEFGVDLVMVSKLTSVMTSARRGEYSLRFRAFEDRPRGVLSRRLRVNVDADFAFLGEVWGGAFTVWKSYCPRYVLQFVYGLLSEDEWHNDPALYKSCKRISDTVKKYADYIDWDRPNDWQFAVHLELFGSYQNELNVEDFIPDVEDWVMTNRVHDALTGDYDMLFRNQLSVWMSSTNKSRFDLSFDDWLSYRYTWARSGSSTTELGRGVARTKWNVAWSMDNAKLKQIMTNVKDISQIKHTLIQKLELGKVRGVIGVDDALYLAMAYISEFVEDDLGHTKMYNFLNTDSQAAALEEISSGGVLIPLDESGFDHNKNARQVLDCVSHIGKFAMDRCEHNRSDLLSCIKFVERFIYGGVIVLGGKVISIKRGVLSGWRWTYLIDTMINVTQMYLAISEMRIIGCPVDVKFICSGDDVGTLFTDCRAAAAFLCCYKSYGYEVNPSKFWVSNTRNEFIRLTVTSTGVRGYANRMVSKLMLGSPRSDGFVDKYERVQAIVSNWSRMHVRGVSRRVALEWCYRDVSGIMGIGLGMARRWCHTPISYGGGGAADLEAGVGLTLNRSKSAEEERGVKLNSFAGIKALADFINGKTNATAEESRTMFNSVVSLAKGSIKLKQKTFTVDDVFMTTVIIPEPTRVDDYTDNVIPPFLVGSTWEQLSSFIIGSALDGEPVSRKVLDHVALDSFIKNHTGWTDGAKRAWLTGKIPTSTCYFSGRDVVRIARAARVLNTLVAKSKRMTLEMLRRIAYNVGWSSVKWYPKNMVWFE